MNSYTDIFPGYFCTGLTPSEYRTRVVATITDDVAFLNF